MKLFISDLHVGDGSRTDDFHRDRAFLSFLEFAGDEAEELIIVGDLFELWQARLDRVLFCHSEIVRALLALRKKIRVTYVVGNHDYVPFARFVDTHAAISLEYRDPSLGIVAEHGNRYDIFNRYKNPLKSLRWPLGKRLSLLLAGLERVVSPDADEWTKEALIHVEAFLREAGSVRNKIPPSSEEYIKRGGHFGEFEKAIQGHLSKDARTVIFGHTYKCQLKRVEKGIYANCGTWVDRATPTYIACSREKIALREGLTHKTLEELVLL